MVDGVAVEDDQLEGAGQFEDALDLGLHLGDAVGARVAALHQRPLRRIVEQRTFGQRYVGADPCYYDPARRRRNQITKKKCDPAKNQSIRVWSVCKKKYGKKELFSGDAPSFEAMFEEIEKGFLHHVGHFVALEGRSDEDDGSHGRHHIIRRKALGFLEERLALLFRARSAAQAGRIQLRLAHRVRIVACKKRHRSRRRRPWPARHIAVPSGSVTPDGFGQQVYHSAQSTKQTLGSVRCHSLAISTRDL